jgi:hypothetical protein
LHRELGDDIVINRGARQVRLRLVAALRDSIFQGELLMSQSNFLKLFRKRRDIACSSFKQRRERAMAAADVIERALTDFGADATPDGGAACRVPQGRDTYLSTFQALGGPGPSVGTSAWPRFCFATCSSGGASSRCSGRSVMRAGISLSWCLRKTRCC